MDIKVAEVELRNAYLWSKKKMNIKVDEVELSVFISLFSVNGYYASLIHCFLLSTSHISYVSFLHSTKFTSALFLLFV